MMLSSQQMQLVQDWLTARLGYCCPVCHGQQFSFLETVEMQASSGRQDFIPITCSECNHVIFLAAFGLTAKSAKP
jgi:hypothetical protein